MGTSSSMNTSNQYVKYEIGISQNWQSTTDNCTSVSVWVNFWRTNTGYETYGTGTIYCKIDGTLYTASVSPSQKITHSGITLFSKSLLIYHNSNGTKNLNVSAWISLNTPLTSTEQWYSETLPNIPRQAVIISVQNSDGTQDFAVEDLHRVVYEKYSDAFTYNLQIDVKAPGTSEYWKVCVLENYPSGQDIKFSYDPDLDIIYRKLGTDITTDSYAIIRYTLKTYNNGVIVGEDPKEINEKIKTAVARITKLEDFDVEKANSLEYKSYSNRYSYGIWILARKAGTNNYYQSIFGQMNYVSGTKIQFTQEQINQIYSIASPDIKNGSYVDVIYHLHTYDQNGNYLDEESQVKKGRINQAIAQINSISDSTIEQEHYLNYTKYSNYFWYNLWIRARKSGTNNGFEEIANIGDYQSGQAIKFSDESIIKMYNMLGSEAKLGALLDIEYNLETWESKGGNCINTSPRTIQKAIGGSMYINDSETWKGNVPFLNVNGFWKPCLAYINANGVWKKGEVK